MESICRACGLRHNPLLRCERIVRVPDVVANKVVANTVVANRARAEGGRKGDRHDKVRRRAYMKSQMARVRAKRKSTKEGS